MKHEYMPKGSMVYEEGSYGTQFYILLMGTATVYISNPEDQICLSGFKKFKPLSQK